MRLALPWLGALAVILVVVWGRAFFEARTAFAAGQAAEASGEMDETLAQYQYAMRWYTPFAETPEAAATALARLADAAEAAGDRTRALAALRRLRGGALSTRSFYSPFGDRLAGEAGVDARIARLSAAEQTAAGLARGESLAALEVEHRRLLALDPTPSTAWAVAATLGFCGWIGGALGFIFRGLDAGLRLAQPAAQRWSLLFATSFGVWMLGLWLA